MKTHNNHQPKWNDNRLLCRIKRRYNVFHRQEPQPQQQQQNIGKLPYKLMRVIYQHLTHEHD